MPRQASPLTTALRELFAQHNGKITYTEARPLLEKAGFQLAVDPGALSENMKKFEDIAKNYSEPSRREAEKLQAFRHKIAAEKMGLNGTALKALMTEFEHRDAYAREENNFNVTKYQWGLSARGKGKGSRKPTQVRNVKAAATRKGVRKNTPKRREVAAISANDQGREEAAFAELQRLGGVAAVQQQVEDLRKQAEELANKATELEQTLALAQNYVNRLMAA